MSFPLNMVRPGQSFFSFLTPRKDLLNKIDSFLIPSVNFRFNLCRLRRCYRSFFKLSLGLGMLAEVSFIPFFWSPAGGKSILFQSIKIPLKICKLPTTSMGVDSIFINNYGNAALSGPVSRFFS